MSETVGQCPACGGSNFAGHVCDDALSSGFVEECRRAVDAIASTLEQKQERLQKLIGEQQTEISKLRAQLEQERIQHAGCLMAAEGWALSDVPKKGEWAWSPAFQAVLELRTKLEAAEPSESYWDSHSVSCGNCGVELLARKGDFAGNNGLSVTDPGSEDEHLCGRCAGAQMYIYQDELELAEKDRSSAQNAAIHLAGQWNIDRFR